MSDPDGAKRLIENTVQKNSAPDGFCVLSGMKPSKRDGYIQLSSGGANKFAMLQEVLLWAAGYTLGEGQQASHLCKKPSCTVIGHVVPESAVENNQRKGCGAVIPCSHAGCAKYHLACQHLPRCITYVPGFESWEAFLRDGLHGPSEQ
jgi:hypothetical protein